MEQITGKLISFSEYLNYLININYVLTSKQEQICELLCLGLKVPEIAKRLCKSVHTIESHIQKIKENTELSSITLISCWFCSKKVQKMAGSGHMQSKKPQIQSTAN